MKKFQLEDNTNAHIQPDSLHTICRTSNERAKNDGKAHDLDSLQTETLHSAEILDAACNNETETGRSESYLALSCRQHDAVRKCLCGWGVRR